MLSLLRHGLAAALFLYLPLLGLVIAGSTVSLFLNFFGRENSDARSLRLSREAIDTLPVGTAALLLSGLLPLPVIAFLWQRILGGESPLPGISWLLPLGTLFAGCVLLSAYRSAIRQTADLSVMTFRAGVAGLLAALLATSLLFVMTGTLFDHSKLPLIRSHVVFLLSYHSLAEFLLFLAMSFGLTGGIVLLSRVRAKAGTETPDPDYEEYAHSIGRGLALAAAPAVPLLVVLRLISLPETALSLDVFAAAGAVQLLALVVVVLLFLLPRKREARPGALIPTLYVLMFLAVAAGDRAAVDNSAWGRIAPPPLPGVTGIPAEPAVDKGRAVFQARCRPCHQLETRVVGPPLKEAVSKYRGDFERLKNYIRTPAKVDPAYPLMPNLGLRDEEVDAVARYLLGAIGEKLPPEKPVTADQAVLDKGKAVFEAICSACHRFELRVVGPPLNEVVPTYQGDLEKLKGFIRNPVKVSPGYPAMPALGLKEEEIDAVARYLLSKAGRQG